MIFFKQTQSLLVFFFFCSVLVSKPVAAQQISTLPTVDVRSLIERNEKVSLKPGEATYAITITVTNIRNREGVIRFKFYDDTTPFPHDTGFLRIVVPKSDFTGSSFTVTYTGFTSRNMAIALQDDENENAELEMGWFYPKEGHAFSDYYHTAFRIPVYDDFDFFLNSDRKVLMKVRYY